jgi:hypothetical protein
MRKITILLASAILAFGTLGCSIEHHDHRPARVIEYYRVERADVHHGYYHGHGGYGHRDHGYRRYDDCR